MGKGLNLERIAIAHNLQLRHAALPGISLLGASIKADILLQDSAIAGWAWLENLQVGSDLFMERSSLARTDLQGAAIGGNLKMTGSGFAGPLDMRGIKVAQDLLMDAGSYQDIAIPDGDIGYNLRLDGSHVAGSLTMPAAHVGHVLSLGKKGSFDGPVNLAYVKVDGGVLLTGSSFAKGVDLDGAVIGEGLSRHRGRADLRPAQHDLRQGGQQCRPDGRQLQFRRPHRHHHRRRDPPGEQGLCRHRLAPGGEARAAQRQRQGPAGSARRLAHRPRSRGLHL